MDLFSTLSLEAILPFVLTCIVIESTPGPNMAFLTLISATKGRRYGFAMVAGITLGLMIIGLAAATGLAAVIANSDLLYQGLRFAGVFYLLWLAFEEWRDAGREGPKEIHAKDSDGNMDYFRHGLIVNLLNPKAGVFYIAILPQFIGPEGDLFLQGMTLTLVYVFIAAAAHIIIVVLAGFLRPVLENPRRKRLIRRILSVLLAGIAIWVGLSA